MIVGLTVSVDYTDLLRVTMPSIKAAVDHLFVITKEHDDVLDLCRDTDTSTMTYNGWHKDGAKFNKSGAIAAAQEYIHEAYPDAWVAIIDADVVLPPTLKQSTEEASDKQALYSLTRVDYHTPQKYRDNQATYYAFPFSGYCQIYHRKDVRYPAWSHTASHCDCFFRDQFATWIRLPGIAAHLGRDQQNWCGRKSDPWT